MKFTLEEKQLITKKNKSPEELTRLVREGFMRVQVSYGKTEVVWCRNVMDQMWKEYTSGAEWAQVLF